MDSIKQEIKAGKGRVVWGELKQNICEDPKN